MNKQHICLGQRSEGEEALGRFVWGERGKAPMETGKQPPFIPEPLSPAQRTAALKRGEFAKDWTLK